MNMDKHSLELLEFGKIREELASYCFSEEGMERVEEEFFFGDVRRLSEFIDRVDDFQILLEQKESALPVRFPSTASILKKLSKEGTVLEEDEFLRLRQQLVCGRFIRGFILSDSGEGESPISKDSLLHAAAETIPTLKFLEKSINRVITPEGKVDEKIPALAAIRKRITEINGEIDSIAVSMLGNPKYRDYVQDQIPGQKDGRTVLPVKAQHKQKIQGLVQDVSSSGATIFIEPYELVDKNNELALEKGKYRREIHRILQELTTEIREHREELEEMRSVLIDIDAVYCRARYSCIHGCSRVEISDTTFRLLNSRHPLLGPSAVPIELIAGAGTKTVVISGPNTGGKTVGLKTAGLLSVMHQFGMKLPVGEGSSLPIFSDVFTDIGDEQSIDLSLSTFSGHMRRISGICDSADENSLVLLDELGSGTDAVEGGALAMAVLDYLSDIGCTTIVTTHQSSLKNYAFGRAEAENASVEFDLRKLRPTFRLLNGVPGESHALEIAEMMGMDKQIMEKAHEYREKGLSDINTIIREITKKQQEVFEREESIRGDEEVLRRREDELKIREEELRKTKEGLQRGDERELEAFIRETRKNLENLIRELREGEISREKTKKAKEFVKELEGKLESARKPAEPKRKEVPLQEKAKPFHEGMEVLFIDNNKKGSIVRKGKGNKWVVALGNLKIEAEETEIRPVRPAKERTASVDYSAEKVHVPMELDIRGLRYEEAEQELRRYVDNAVLQGRDRLEIIHGKGEGVLQQAVRNVLSELPIVADYQFAPPESGGFGKTIVTLHY